MLPRNRGRKSIINLLIPQQCPMEQAHLPFSSEQLDKHNGACCGEVNRIVKLQLQQFQGNRNVCKTFSSHTPSSPRAINACHQPRRNSQAES